jgi:hypothetical protein
LCADAAKEAHVLGAAGFGGPEGIATEDLDGAGVETGALGFSG